MRFIQGSTLAVAVVILIPAMGKAQDQTKSSRSIAGGGILVPGWMGKIDANNEERAARN
jgi:hypothetical protein